MTKTAKIYIHEGEGYHIGSTIIVYADRRKSAEKLIRAELDLLGLPEEELSIVCKGKPKIPSIIYSDNGDY